MKFVSPGTIIHRMNIAGQTTQLNILDSKLLRRALVAMATEIIFITRF